MKRTFGWVQNPGKFSNLKKVVEVFDIHSNMHKKLHNILSNVIYNQDKLEQLLISLNTTPLELTYSELVGTGTAKRNEAKCDSIIQAVIKPQDKSKQYTDNWTADGFVRWAECLGFIKYNSVFDSFKITESGLKYSQLASEYDDQKMSKEEIDILIEQVLKYPPATRILKLLSNDDTYLTKFEIGKKLGFSGEDGFTSYPQNIFVNYLLNEHDVDRRTKARSNWEGSSDKYARMICTWLKKLGLVQERKREISDSDGIVVLNLSEYYITAFGYNLYRSSLGISSRKKIKKNVSYGMLATTVRNRDYIRFRRAMILKKLLKSDKTIEDLSKSLQAEGLNDDMSVLEIDICGLNNIGIQIEKNGNYYSLVDSITDFEIPKSAKEHDIEDLEIKDLKEKLIKELPSIDKSFIELVEISLDGKQSRLFEMKTIDLFVSEYGFAGIRLGEAHRPDGILQCSAYGIIVDTKAYSKGYDLPISQQDEMVRYIEDNKKRDRNINLTEWWSNFVDELDTFYFLFVSSYFKGEVDKKLKKIANRTGINGAAISIIQLLYGAEYIKSKRMTISDLEHKINNKEIFITDHEISLF